MVLGLGSGSTVNFMLEELKKRIQNGLNISGIPTSKKTEKLANSYHIPLTNFEKHEEVDLAIDGADKVDKDFNLIKGGGGSLLREKIVASTAKQVVIIVDHSKIVNQFKNVTLPVEVVPFAWIQVYRQISNMGAKIVLRKSGDNIFSSDNDNYILDCTFPYIKNPKQLHTMLKMMVGVVETGLFIDMADYLIISNKNTIEIKNRN